MNRKTILPLIILLLMCSCNQTPPTSPVSNVVREISCSVTFRLKVRINDVKNKEDYKGCRFDIQVFTQHTIKLLGRITIEDIGRDFEFTYERIDGFETGSQEYWFQLIGWRHANPGGGMISKASTDKPFHVELEVIPNHILVFASPDKFSRDIDGNLGDRDNFEFLLKRK